MSPIRDPREAPMHDPAHGGVVARILCGDLGHDSAEAQAVLGSCAQCRADLAALAGVTRMLDATAREESETLAEVQASPSDAAQVPLPGRGAGAAAAQAAARAKEQAPGRTAEQEAAHVPAAARASSRGVAPAPERGAAYVRGDVTPTAPPRSPSTDPRVRRRWVLPIALAAGLVFAFVLYSVLTDAKKTEHVLGAYAIECRTPVGAVEQYTEFRARGAKPAHGWFRFEIYDESAAPGSPPVLAADHRPETVWVPKKEELVALPARIRWRIFAVDASGNVVDEDTATAWRSH